MTKTGKRRLAAALMILLFVVVFLGASELFVRLVFGDQIILFPRFHEEAQYGPFTLRRLRPNTTFFHRSVDGIWRFQINAQGFRDTRDYSYNKPPGVCRVICLGDSHTQGFECDQNATYPKVLEQLASRSGHRLEALNTGISGFGTAEQLIFLEQEGLKYQPDYVVLAFYSNDLDDNVKCGLFGLQNDQLITNKLAHAPGVRALKPINDFPVTRWLSQHSYLYSMVMNFVWTTMKNRLSRKMAEAAPVEYAVGMTPTNAAVQAYQEKLTAALLERMGRTCREHGAKLIIVEVPHRTGPATFRPSIPPALKDVVVSASHAVLWSTNLFGNFPDPTTIFRPHGQWHITEKSHAAIAEAVAAVILASHPSTNTSPSASNQPP